MLARSLDTIEVAAPCSANWADMAGDDRSRFCGECNLHVYNLSGLTRAAAERLMREKEGRLCVRLYWRRDGKVLTSDCPVGLTLARRAATRWLGWAAGFVLGLLTLIFVAPALIGPHRGSAGLRQLPVVGDFLDWLDPAPGCVMGKPAFIGPRPGPGDADEG